MSVAVAERTQAPGRRRAALIHVLTNYASVIFLIVKGLVLVPLYLRSFGADGYGAWLASGNVLSMIAVVESGFTLIFAQRLSAAFGEKDVLQFSRVLGSGGVMLSLMATCITCGALVSAPWIPSLVHADVAAAGVLPKAFALAGVGAGLTLLQTIIFSVFYAWQRPLIVGAIKLGAQFMEVVAIIVGLKTGLGLIALGLGSVVGGSLGAAASLLVAVGAFRHRSHPSPRFSGSEAMTLARGTVPLFFSRAAAIGVSNNEPLFISVLIGPSEAAMLALTDRVFKIGQMLVNPLAGSVFYGLAHLSAENRNGERVTGVIQEIIPLGSVFALLVFGTAVVLNPAFMTLWVGPSHFGGLGLNVALASAAVLTVRGNLFGMLLSALGRLTVSTWCNVAEMSLRIPLLIIFIRRFGLIGLPLAVIVASLLVSSWSYALAIGRVLGIRRPEIARLAVLGLPTTAVALVTAYLGAAAMPTTLAWLDFVLSALLLTTGAVLVTLVLHRPLRAQVFRVIETATPMGALNYARAVRAATIGRGGSE